MKKYKDISNIDQITPEWITEVLRKKGNLHEGSITSILRKDFQKLNSSNLYFLELEFSNDAKVELPSALLTKQKTFKETFLLYFQSNIVKEKGHARFNIRRNRTRMGTAE